MVTTGLANNRQLVEALHSGGVAVIRTDTLYGLVARADNEDACNYVYVLKKRRPTKSCIILIANPSDCYGDAEELSYDISHIHDIPTSFLISSPHAPSWLLCANNDLAYRVPADEGLRELLRQTGPLIAPSANPEGAPPARTISEAKAYFGDDVDIYVDGGEVPLDINPSRLLRLHKDGSKEWLRK